MFKNLFDWNNLGDKKFVRNLLIVIFLLLMLFIFVKYAYVTYAEETTPEPIKVQRLPAQAVTEITGPLSGAAGQMAVFKTTVPAVWIVLPPEFAQSLYVDSSGTTAAFASPVPGTVYLVAAVVVEQKPSVHVATFLNGDDSRDWDIDNPDKKTDVTEVTEENKMEKLLTEWKAKSSVPTVNAMKSTFVRVIAAIDNHSIQTAKGARETFRATWQAEAVRVSTTCIQDNAAFLTELSEFVKTDDIAELRTLYTQVITTLNKE